MKDKPGLKGPAAAIAAAMAHSAYEAQGTANVTGEIASYAAAGAAGAAGAGMPQEQQQFAADLQKNAEEAKKQADAENARVTAFQDAYTKKGKGFLPALPGAQQR